MSQTVSNCIRAALPAFLLVALTGPVLGQPRKVILDTDPSFDPDDVGCMAMLHAMANRGECEILAVMNSINHRESAPTISAINTFYKRPAIPIGEYRGYEEYIDAPDDLYTYDVVSRYPHGLKDHNNAADSVKLYREILATAPRKSVTVIVIGTMHNLYGLLQSTGDVYSPLSGVDLVREKVQLVATMGGNFIDGKGFDRTNWGGSDELCGYTSWSCLDKERNAMCRYVIENCPAPFVASGWEVGCGDYHDAEQGNVMTGQELKKLPDNHIARRCYEFHFSTRGGEERIDRHSNDQCALHYAIRGEGPNYTAFLNGEIKLSETGVCTWDSRVNRSQGYIQKNRDPELIAKEIESLMMESPTPTPQSAPEPPTQLTIQQNGTQFRINWEPVVDSKAGSWVVGYLVEKDGEILRTVYGTQLVDDIQPGKRHGYDIRAINASGVAGEAASIRVMSSR